MLSSLYVEALLADSDHADRVWQDWYSGRISDAVAAREWLRIAARTATQQRARGSVFGSAPPQPQTGRSPGHSVHADADR